jgi:hypothetical protein
MGLIGIAEGVRQRAFEGDTVPGLEAIDNCLYRHFQIRQPTGEAMSPVGGPVSTNVTSTARLDLFEHLGESVVLLHRSGEDRFLKHDFGIRR